MANIPLKSIKFPDLADTYTVPSNAGELPYNKSATYPADTVGKALQNIGDSSAPAIIETATGSIASFTDGANVPVKDLVAEIVPLQSGSGDPSPDNVRPITGWTECNVVVSPTEDAQDGETHTISFASAGTVYGGRLDVTSGVLVVDKMYAQMPTNWTQNSFTPPNMFVQTYEFTGLPSVTNGDTEIRVTSDMFKGATAAGILGASSGHNSVAVISSKRMMALVSSTEFPAAEDFNTWVASNNPHVCFELATPQTYQLTPTEVKTLLENNNIWADTGDVTVEYVADTKTFIENLVNA